MSYSDEEKPSPFRSRGFIFGAIVLGVIAAAAIVAVVLGLVAPGAQPEPGPTAAPSETAQPVDDASVCGLDDVQMEGSVEEAPPTEWAFVGRTAVPASAGEAGAGVVESDGFRYCYSRTPEGALYAAGSFVALTIDRSTLDQVADKLLAPGVGRDAAISSAPSTMAKPAEAFTMDITGFRVLAYDGDTARVDLAVRMSTGDLMSFVVDLEWSGGDWKVLTTDEGAQKTAPALIESLGGYIPWSGGL
jgi:hypothetical protein